MIYRGQHTETKTRCNCLKTGSKAAKPNRNKSGIVKRVDESYLLNFFYILCIDINDRCIPPLIFTQHYVSVMFTAPKGLHTHVICSKKFSLSMTTELNFMGTVNFADQVTEPPCGPVVTFPSFSSEGHGV